MPTQVTFDDLDLKKLEMLQKNYIRLKISLHFEWKATMNFKEKNFLTKTLKMTNDGGK